MLHNIAEQHFDKDGRKHKGNPIVIAKSMRLNEAREYLETLYVDNLSDHPRARLIKQATRLRINGSLFFITKTR